jgi:hypothetical protein
MVKLGCFILCVVKMFSWLVGVTCFDVGMGYGVYLPFICYVVNLYIKSYPVCPIYNGDFVKILSYIYLCCLCFWRCPGFG